MNKSVLYILFFLFAFQVKAQNLISNSSFEYLDSCYGQPAPIGFDVFNWTGCIDWSCPTAGSSDLWCENPVYGIQNPPFIPGVGFQFPYFGENYSGILMFSLNDQNYREYIQNKLITPLEENQYYNFSIRVSTNEDSINYSSCLQAFFSTSALFDLNYNVLSFQPQWKNPDNNFIKDSIGWQLISGIFKAQGGEQFVTIGCFDDSANVVMKNKDPFSTSDIYYFLDDVTIEKAPIEIEFPNVFTPTDDGINDFYSPIIIGIPDYRVFIYNRWGNIICTLDSKTTAWNGKNEHEGTYFYILKSEELNIIEQGFFQLIR